MVFAREDDAAHVGKGQRVDDGVGVELRGLEEIRVFIAVTPFLVGESIDGEVQKRRGFELMPEQLPVRWHGAERRGLRRERGKGGGTGESRKKCASGCGVHHIRYLSRDESMAAGRHR